MGPQMCFGRRLKGVRPVHADRLGVPPRQGNEKVRKRHVRRDDPGPRWCNRVNGFQGRALLRQQEGIAFQCPSTVRRADAVHLKHEVDCHLTEKSDALERDQIFVPAKPHNTQA